MLNIRIHSGSLVSNTTTIAPLSKSEFKNAISSLNVEYDFYTPNNDWSNFGFPIEFYGKEFSFVITFHGESLHSTFLSWHEGVSEKRNYETTEQELRADQRTLTKFLEKIFDRAPDVKKGHVASFHFDWGYVAANYSIRSLTVGIGIAWDCT